MDVPIDSAVGQLVMGVGVAEAVLMRMLSNMPFVFLQRQPRSGAQSAPARVVGVGLAVTDVGDLVEHGASAALRVHALLSAGLGIGDVLHDPRRSRGVVAVRADRVGARADGATDLGDGAGRDSLRSRVEADAVELSRRGPGQGRARGFDCARQMRDGTTTDCGRTCRPSGSAPKTQTATHFVVDAEGAARRARAESDAVSDRVDAADDLRGRALVVGIQAPDEEPPADVGRAHRRRAGRYRPTLRQRGPIALKRDGDRRRDRAQQDGIRERKHGGCSQAGRCEGRRRKQSPRETSQAVCIGPTIMPRRPCAVARTQERIIGYVSPAEGLRDRALAGHEPRSTAAEGTA